MSEDPIKLKTYSSNVQDDVPQEDSNLIASKEDGAPKIMITRIKKKVHGLEWEEEKLIPQPDATNFREETVTNLTNFLRFKLRQDLTGEEDLGPLEDPIAHEPSEDLLNQVYGKQPVDLANEIVDKIEKKHRGFLQNEESRITSFVTEVFSTKAFVIDLNAINEKTSHTMFDRCVCAIATLLSEQTLQKVRSIRESNHGPSTSSAAQPSTSNLSERGIVDEILDGIETPGVVSLARKAMEVVVQELTETFQSKAEVIGPHRVIGGNSDEGGIESSDPCFICFYVAIGCFVSSVIFTFIIFVIHYFVEYKVLGGKNSTSIN